MSNEEAILASLREIKASQCAPPPPKWVGWAKAVGMLFGAAATASVTMWGVGTFLFTPRVEAMATATVAKELHEKEGHPVMALRLTNVETAVVEIKKMLDERLPAKGRK